MSILNPSSLLDIVQRAQQRCQLASLTSTVVAQTGQSLDFVLWADEAWVELQDKRDDWGFMRASASFPTVASQVYYTPAQAGVTAGVKTWLRHTFRMYPTGNQSGEIFLTFEEYDNFRDVYQIGALRTSEVQPVIFTITPALSIGIQTPLTGYTITGDYMRTTEHFDEDDADVPTGLPGWGVMALVYRTQMFYAAAENDPTMYNEAEKQYNQVLNRLTRIYSPEIKGPGPLA